MELIPFIKAQQLIIDSAKRYSAEKVALERAHNRVMASHVTADRDYPPFNRAAMDGYALPLESLQKGITEFYVLETIYAGCEPTKPFLNSNDCYAIMTGAAVPNNCDIVIKVEDTTRNGDKVLLHPKYFKLYQNIAQKGEDITAGTVVFNKSKVCTPTVMATLAALGCANVEVYRLPVVYVISTGNEIIPYHTTPQPTQIRNSNAVLLTHFLKKWGIENINHTHVLDDLHAIEKAIKHALEVADVVITIGGVSAGTADYVPAALASAGVELLFHKVAIKPGKPFAFGLYNGNKPVFSLPGNPVSVQATYKIFVEPYLNACVGLAAFEPILIPTLESRERKVHLTEFVLGEIQKTPQAAVKKVKMNGSGDVVASAFADGFFIHYSDVAQINQGELVPFIYW